MQPVSRFSTRPPTSSFRGRAPAFNTQETPEETRGPNFASGYLASRYFSGHAASDSQPRASASACGCRE
jgi:hypothetical protein